MSISITGPSSVPSLALTSTSVTTSSTALTTTNNATSSPSSSLSFPVVIDSLIQISRMLQCFGTLSRQTLISLHILARHPFSKRPNPNWPAHLAIFVAVVKGVFPYREQYAENLHIYRSALDSIFIYVPQPFMTAIPFKIMIPKGGRELEGVLEKLESQETGHRVLGGEWVCDSKVWKTVMAMPIAKRLSSTTATKDPFAARVNEKVILYFHGGGYTICSTATHRELLYRISRATGQRIYSVNYRLAPEHPFPAALQDANHAFCHLIDPQGLGFDARQITVAGDSAGAGLATALMMYQRDFELPTPSKGVLLSPWLDLTMSCESWETNAEFDYLPSRPVHGEKFNPIAMYTGRDKVKTLARHPYVSPLLGNVEDLPPLLIQCGESERFRDECVLYTHKARGTMGPTDHRLRIGKEQVLDEKFHNPRVELDMYHGMVHVFQAIPFLPEANIALLRIREFLDRKGSEQEAEMAALEAMEALEP